MTKAEVGEWYIFNNGDITEEPISGDVVQITLPFNTSNRQIGANVWTEDCTTPFTNADAYFGVQTTTPSSSEADGFIQFNTTLNVNITALNATSYWEAFEDGTRGGWVQACIETYLELNDTLNLGNDDTVQKVDFKNTVLNISVSLTSTFEVDAVNVDREEVTQTNITTDFSEYLSTYLCNADDIADTPPAVYNQGDQIAICATDDSTDIVQVESFVNVAASQDGGVSNYNYMRDYLFNPEITSTPACVSDATTGRRVCYVKIIALPRFFRATTPSPLTITGTVDLIRDDGRRVRRELRVALPAVPKNSDALAVSTRRTQADGEEEGTGDFEVTASLRSSVVESAAPNLIAGAATASLVAMTVGALMA